MTDSNSNRIDVTVRVADGTDEQFDAVVRALTGAGLAEIQAHRRFRLVTGSAEVAELQVFSQIDGVESVRPDTRYRAK